MVYYICSQISSATSNYLDNMTTWHPGFITPCNTRYA